MSIDTLQDKIRAKKNPTVAGLDPKLEFIPRDIVERSVREYGETLKAAAEAVYEFNRGLIDALCDVVPAVKPQSAYYERFGAEGVEVFRRTVAYAKQNGLFVIADVKRGDIGSTAQAYSDAYLGSVKVGSAEIEPFGCDAVTVNGYLGSDGILPFVETCRERDKCIFVLVKTSNASSGELQDLVAGDRVVYKVMGDLVERLGRDSAGKYGYSCVGAVVGATYPSDLRELRKRLENTFFLVPGYGAQGGSADDVRFAFDRYGYGAVINSSRAIMCAWQKSGGNYKDCARHEAIRMRDELRKYITIV